MKLIIAYLQPDRLNAVKEELFRANVGKLSVIPNAQGCGQQKGYTEAYRGHVTEINLRPKIRIEIAVNDSFVQPTIDAIIKAARTGKIGDGKIFVIPLETCIRIRTGETGATPLDNVFAYRCLWVCSLHASQPHPRRHRHRSIAGNPLPRRHAARACRTVAGH